MSPLDTDSQVSGSRPAAEPRQQHGEHRSGDRSSHSRWMMLACCVPMLAIAGIAVAAGAGIGFLIIAVMCTVMMAAMMGGISHGGGRGTDDSRG